MIYVNLGVNQILVNIANLIINVLISNVKVVFVKSNKICDKLVLVVNLIIDDNEII